MGSVRSRGHLKVNVHLLIFKAIDPDLHFGPIDKLHRDPPFLNANNSIRLVYLFKLPNSIPENISSDSPSKNDFVVLGTENVVFIGDDSDKINCETYKC